MPMAVLETLLSAWEGVASTLVAGPFTMAWTWSVSQKHQHLWCLCEVFLLNILCFPLLPLCGMDGLLS